MANGTIHKLGTLYINGTKKKIARWPWYRTSGGAQYSGDIYELGYNDNSVEIRDSDALESYRIQWVEVNDGAERILICDRNLLGYTDWNTLEQLGFCGSKGNGKRITIDGQEYELFMLSGGTDSSVQTEVTPSNEWDKYIGNLGNFPGLPTPQWQDLQNKNDKENFNTEHNKLWNWAGCKSWCCDIQDSDYSKRICRGFTGARHWESTSPSLRSGTFSWRPALRILNLSPVITPDSYNMGNLLEPQNITYKIEDSNGDRFDVTVKIDNTIRETYTSQTDRSYTLQMSKYWDGLGYGTHTIQITASDGISDNSVIYTFTRQKVVPTISPASLSLGQLSAPRDISYTVNDIGNNSLTIIVKIDQIEKERYANQGNTSKTFQMSRYWSTLGSGAHTVTVEVTNSLGNTSTATYTFSKSNTAPLPPQIYSPLDGERREASFYVGFTIGRDPEGDIQTFRVQTADDPDMSINLSEFSGLEKYVDSSWISVSSASNADAGGNFRIHVAGMSGEKYIRIVSTDSGSGTEVFSSVVHIRIGASIEVMTHPSETQEQANQISVLIDLVADSKVTKEIWVCNNANDTSPTWEAYVPDSAGNHTFINSKKTAARWAIAVKVKISANNSTGEIALRAIGMGVT